LAELQEVFVVGKYHTISPLLEIPLLDVDVVMEIPYYF
jgi:hypothetical protein